MMKLKDIEKITDAEETEKALTLFRKQLVYFLVEYCSTEDPVNSSKTVEFCGLVFPENVSLNIASCHIPGDFIAICMDVGGDFIHDRIDCRESEEEE